VKQNEDILKTCAELKQMPFSVPEGYFDAFKTENARACAQKVGLWDRLAPIAAMAAVFIFLAASGTFLLEHSVRSYDMTEEDYVMFSDNMTNAIAYEMEYEAKIAEAEASEEDIINYLIYTGVTAEHIELSK